MLPGHLELRRVPVAKARIPLLFLDTLPPGQLPHHCTSCAAPGPQPKGFHFSVIRKIIQTSQSYPPRWNQTAAPLFLLQSLSSKLLLIHFVPEHSPCMALPGMCCPFALGFWVHMIEKLLSISSVQGWVSHVWLSLQFGEKIPSFTHRVEKRQSGSDPTAFADRLVGGAREGEDQECHPDFLREKLSRCWCYFL